MLIRYMGEWRYSSTILDLRTRWRWMVSFTPLPFYPRGDSPLYPLDMKVGGSQSRIEPRFVGCPALSPSWYRLFWRKGTYIFVSCIIVATSAFLSVSLYTHLDLFLHVLLHLTTEKSGKYSIQSGKVLKQLSDFILSGLNLLYEV
jgi:hypothetical protein